MLNLNVFGKKIYVKVGKIKEPTYQMLETKYRGSQLQKRAPHFKFASALCVTSTKQCMPTWTQGVKGFTIVQIIQVNIFAKYEI